LKNGECLPAYTDCEGEKGYDLFCSDDDGNGLMFDGTYGIYAMDGDVEDLLFGYEYWSSGLVVSDCEVGDKDASCI